MTADTLAPFPLLPPPPVDPGEYLSHFGGDIIKFAFDPRTQDVILHVKVDPADKYKALPLSDVRGRRFAFTVHTPRGARPLVASGKLAVYAGREGRVQRTKDRRWGKQRAMWWSGVDGD